MYKSILNHKKFQELLASYSQKAGPPTERLTEGRPKDMLDLIKKLNQPEECYILIDLRTTNPIWHHGIDSYLGYASLKNEEMPIEFFLSTIHPFVREWIMAFIAGMYKCMLEKKISYWESTETRYVVNIPLRKEDGTYMHVKQVSMPFQFDKKGVMVSHLTRYVMINNYKGESLRPRIFHKEQRLQNDEELLFKEAAGFLSLNPKDSLQPALWNVVGEILKVPKAHSGNIAKMIGPHLRKQGGEKLSSESINSYLSRTLRGLQPLLDLPAENSKNDEEQELLHWLPDFHDVHTLIEFLDESRILKLLQIVEQNEAHPS